jgi:hypothetical protein
MDRRKLNAMNKLVYVLLMHLAVAPLARAACSVDATLTDATDYGTRVGRNATDLHHPFRFEAVAPGAELTVMYAYSAFLPFPGIRGHCEDPERCALDLYCLRPGTYTVRVTAQCDVTTVTRTLPLVVPDAGLEVEIPKIESLGPGGQYDVHSVFTMPTGSRLFRASLALFPALPGGGYGNPVELNSHLITASAGDKVQVSALTCNQRVVRAEAIVPAPPSVEVEVVDGNGQRAVVGEPAERSLRVKFVASDLSWDLTAIPAVFEVIAAPDGARGYGVGADVDSVGGSYSAVVGADGIAEAMIVVGDVAGDYVVRVQSPYSLTGTEAVFTITALRPEKVAILKDSSDMADLAPAYAVSAAGQTPFYAVGLDAAGAKIGPMKCTWSTSAKGSPSSRGEGSVAPVQDVRETAFSPLRPGKITLKAASKLKGITAGSADLFVTKLYLSVDNNFSVAAPVDDSPRFVPGMYLDGSNVALDVMKETGQFVSLHLVTGGAKGHATFSIESPTKYPGIAMNYPLADAATTADMMFANGQQSISVNFNPKTGDTWTTLLVQDYGAAGTIKVTMQSGKTSYELAALRLPIDVDANGLPDNGWTALGSTPVSTAGLSATGDDDPAGPAAGSDPAVTGDGLSSFEEFRGFVVAGSYGRLNPRRKEIFIDIDTQLLLGPASALPMLTTLQAHLLYVGPTEVKGVDEPSRGISRTQAVVSFNRGTVPVAHARPQRAIRIVRQVNFPPGLLVPSSGITIPIWQAGVLGATFSDDLIDVDLLGTPGNVPTIETPMRTRFSEIYPRAFTNLAVNTTFSYPEHYDANGNVVPQCTFQGQSNCDIWDIPNHLIVPSRQDALWGMLYTVPSPAHDPVEHYSSQARRCADGGPVVGGLTTLEMERLKGLIAAHEAGHAMRIEHLRDASSDCGDLMFDTEGAAAQRRTMSASLPQPDGFSAKAQTMMRLWQQ